MTERKCGIKQCGKKIRGWIDFGLGGENCDYAKMWFCKEHFDNLMKKVEELIQKERDSGELGKTECYAIVPSHITKEVINIPN